MEFEERDRLLTNGEDRAESERASVPLARHPKPSAGMEKDRLEEIIVFCGRRKVFCDQVRRKERGNPREEQTPNVHVVGWPTRFHPNLPRVVGTEEQPLNECIPPKEETIGDEPLALWRGRRTHALSVIRKCAC